VDNPEALGATDFGSSAVMGADNLGGLYLSNNITWSQALELDPRLNVGVEATAPQIANWSGTNIITSPVTLATGQGGSEINVEATAGQLTIDATSTLANSAGGNDNNLNLQGSATGIWNGVLSDGSMVLNVLKRGAGTWTLGGANTYSGTTTVSNGTLLINGTISGTNVSVSTGGTLGGNGGTIAGPVSVAAGGTLVPGGTGAGVLTISNSLTLASGSFTSVKINKAAATEDKIAGVSALTYGGTLVVSNLFGTLTTSDSFKLFTASNYAGAFSSVTPAPGAGLAWSASTLATDGTLRITTGGNAPTNGTPIVWSVVDGNTLQMSWPATTPAWVLEAQTNSVHTGLGTNWVRVSTSTTTNIVPIVPSNGSVFFRLVSP
jgi:autotransporter-associated beta strand protein